jgi:puromycin-sensitive aminopeptidase
VFSEEVQLCLERRRYANAETTDLWRALGDAAHQPIPAIMDGWIFKPGYPVVTVDLEGGGLKLSQRRFQYLGGETDSGQRWRIPVVLRAAVKRGYVERRLLLDAEAASVELPSKADWIVVNSGGHGSTGALRTGAPQKLAHAAMKSRPSSASTCSATPSRSPRPASCRPSTTST